MNVHVTRVDYNRDYIENKGYMTETYNDDGSISLENNLYALSYRIWLSEKILLRIGIHIRYALYSSKGEVFEGYILEEGIDNYGYYIIFLTDKAIELISEYSNCSISSGIYNLELLFSPEMIQGYNDLISAFDGMQPILHESEFKILTNNNENVTLRFSAGYIDRILFDMYIKNIVSRDFGTLNLEEISKETISDIIIGRRGDLIEVKLVQNTIISKLPEGVTEEDLEDIEKIDEIEFVEESINNYGIFRCQEVEIKLVI